MMDYLCISITFLDSVFNGRSDGERPEWPPSPLRLLQALTSAAAGRWNERERLISGAPTIRWLEQLGAPEIHAPPATLPDERTGATYRLFVPDNVGDLVGRSWSKAGADSISNYRTEKDVQPTYLQDHATVHYVWPVSSKGDIQNYLAPLTTAVRSISHLGWGVDMVVADARVLSQDEADALTGERWFPATSGPVALRVPRAGTLENLASRHTAFLGRINADGFSPVPPLRVFNVQTYRRDTDPAPREFAAFSILKLDASGFRPFDTRRQTPAVAGMVRHAIATLAKGKWPDEKINTFIHGKTPDGCGPATGAASDRFGYLPLPSVTPQGITSIRRVIVHALPHCSDEIAWLRRALSGAELVDETTHKPIAILALLPQSDSQVENFTGKRHNGACVWSTVMPVLLPGYDDPRHLLRRRQNSEKQTITKAGHETINQRRDDLLRKAFRQAGFSPSLVKQLRIEWRSVGFRAGVDLTSRYTVPENLRKYPKLHVRVTFPHPIVGPLAVGSGRFRGLGIFVAEGA